MKKSALELTKVEAGILLSALVSFSDDDPSEEEGVILRKYYRFSDAESAQHKLEKAGYFYPKDLLEADPVILSVLKEADQEFKLRTLAVAWLLARADGNVDQSEMMLLSRYAAELGAALGDAKQYADLYLKEIDESGGYFEETTGFRHREEISLLPEEAGIAVATLVAFSDDDPTDAEAGIIREFYSYDAVANLQKKMTVAGYNYPEELTEMKSAVLKGLAGGDRSAILKMLAIAYKVALADGDADEDEVMVLREYCEEFCIGLSELKLYFASVPEM